MPKNKSQNSSLISKVKKYVKQGKGFYAAAMSPIKTRTAPSINKNVQKLLKKVN